MLKIRSLFELITKLYFYLKCINILLCKGKFVYDRISSLEFVAFHKRSYPSKFITVQAQEVCDKKKIIFIHIPKTGGVSILHALFDGLGVPHAPLWCYKRVYGKAFYEYFTFTFTRHPVTRMESAFYFLKKGGIDDLDRAFMERNLGPYHSFEQFVLEYLNKRSIWSYTHFLPQSWFFERCVSTDNKFYGKLENIESDIGKLKKILGVEFQLEKHNASDPLTQNPPISSKVIDKIYTLYKEDYIRFGYEKYPTRPSKYQ